jgi:hypothetical protein
VVELLPEADRAQPPLVEARHHDQPVQADSPDGLVQGGRAAADLHGRRRAVVPGQATDRLGRCGRLTDHGRSPELPGQPQPLGQRIDRDDLGPGGCGQCGHQQADHALAKDDQGFAEPDIRVEQGIERDRARPGEHAADR